MGVTGKDPELRLEKAGEARMTVENHTADECSILAGVGKRHRNPRSPYSDTPSTSRTHQDLLPLPQACPNYRFPSSGEPPSTLGSTATWPGAPGFLLFLHYSRHMAPHTPLLLVATLLDPAAPPPSRDIRHCSIAPDPLAVRYGAGFSVLLNFLISEISIMMV